MSGYNNKKRILKTTIVASILFIYVVCLQKYQIYSPITYLTGILMPTTGMTRAWLSVLNLDFKAAFKYNALFILAPVLASFIIAYFYTNKHKYLNYAIVMAAILFVYNLFRIF